MPLFYKGRHHSFKSMVDLLCEVGQWMVSCAYLLHYSILLTKASEKLRPVIGRSGEDLVYGYATEMWGFTALWREQVHPHNVVVQHHHQSLDPACNQIPAYNQLSNFVMCKNSALVVQLALLADTVIHSLTCCPHLSRLFATRRHPRSTFFNSA